MMNFAMAAAFGLLGVALAGCADKLPAETLLPVVSVSGGEKTVTVLAAATRGRAKDDPYLFTSDRTGALNYQEYAISIPPSHVVGQIEWPPGSAGNAGTQYVVASSRPLTEISFATALRSQQAAGQRDRRTISCRSPPVGVLRNCSADWTA
jgi:esterase/lipase superfamily enzyme